MCGGTPPCWAGQARDVRSVRGRLTSPPPSVTANISPPSASCSQVGPRPRTRSSVSSQMSCWWCPPSVSSPPRLSSSSLSSQSSQDQPLTSLTSHFIICRTDRRATARKLAENNRNWTLFAAQMSFVILARQNSTVPGACQFFGIVIHFLYLSFFSWTSGSINPTVNC